MTGEPESDTEVPEADRELSAALLANRPLPSAGFRGALGRHLTARGLGYGPRPERLRLAVSGLLGSGALLLTLGALQATGAL